MNKTKFLKKQLLWLYFYLWQIELSIDRAIHNDWGDMVDFLSSRVDINRVLSKMNEVHYFDKARTCSLSAPSRRLCLNFYRRLFNRNFLFDDELEYIYGVLNKYNQLINLDGIPESHDLIELRMEIYDAKSVIKNILGKRKIDSYGCVIHFRHSEYLIVKELEELVGNTWM